MDRLIAYTYVSKTATTTSDFLGLGKVSTEMLSAISVANACMFNKKSLVPVRYKAFCLKVLGRG